jgi:hypothetical protein
MSRQTTSLQMVYVQPLNFFSNRPRNPYGLFTRSGQFAVCCPFRQLPAIKGVAAEMPGAAGKASK